MKNSINLFTRLFLAFIFLIILGGCRQKQNEDNAGGQITSRAVVAVKVGMVVERDAIVLVDVLGKTDALRKEKSYAPITGRVVSLKALEGSEVKKGDVLAVIQTKESEATILGAESMKQSAVTSEQKAEAERIVKLARSTQNSVNVLAKFDGIVSTRSVSEGELVAENAELLTIVDLSTIDFVADVPLRDVSSIQRGQRAFVRFQSIPDKQFPAKVDAINPQTDLQSQTVKARLQFSAQKNSLQSLLRTDMIGTVQIITGIRRRSLFVPNAAILRDDEDNSFSIVIMTADSLAKVIPVAVGTITDSSTEVHAENLRPGMPVVIEGNYALPDSTRLTIVK